MIYSNVPLKKPEETSSSKTTKTFNQYYDVPVQLDQNVLTAMVGFLEKRGFNNTSAESIAITIMIQAKRDNYNPMAILESMKKLSENDLSQIISEILNYNRFKSSVLGKVQQTVVVENVQRNIVA